MATCGAHRCETVRPGLWVVAAAVLVSADVDMGGIARYLEAEDDVRESYWDDVKLQMVCKMWAQEYNKCHPPKQVCVVHAMHRAASAIALTVVVT